jgi:peptide/nickel transport system substrate-binding protein
MSSRRTLIALAVAVLVTACTAETAPPDDEIPRGGTLRVGLFDEFFSPFDEVAFLDPSLSYEAHAWELFRCCLVRTLMSYSGKPTDGGGSELLPDLATGPPEVSADGLTWTYRIRPGIRYSPPLQDVSITTRDIVRALERTALLGGGYAGYYGRIEGFEAFSLGEAESIIGLETPDDHTLVIRLTEPQGDLSYMMALAATGPVPPSPDDPAAPMGTAEGHDADYARFLISSGPYMIEGSGALDFSDPPDQQEPVEGYIPGETLALVRNPSWRGSTDSLRAGYADRIEISVSSSNRSLHAAIDEGEIDLAFPGGPPPQAPPDVVERYRADDGPGRVVFEPRDVQWFITMNLAVPPFDDLHVRRALGFAIDRARVLEEGLGGSLFGRIATHMTPDSFTGGDLVSYDPYGPSGNVEQARAEMARSPYDRDKDGRCDAKVCDRVRAIEFVYHERPLGSFVKAGLAEIGISIEVEVLGGEEYFGQLADPSNQVPLGLSSGWAKDFPDASGWLPALFDSSFIGDGGTNYTLVGASDKQLREWGYSVRGVPNVDDRLDQCLALVGPARTQCWTALDQYLMEQVVPAIPYAEEHFVQVVPDRIASYSYDQFTALPALDRIALEPEG